MNNLDILTKEMCFDDKKLDIFNKIGKSAPITDFAISRGGFVYQQPYYLDSEKLKNRVGSYYVKSYFNGQVGGLGRDGYINYYYVNSRIIGIRLILPYSKIKDKSLKVGRTFDDIIEVEYGFYPQSIPSQKLEDILKNSYNNYSMDKTGNFYTVDNRSIFEYNKGFEPIRIEEYICNGSLYVRVQTNFCQNITTLSNCNRYKKGEYIWIKVEPIKWLVDEKSDIAISKNILLAGIQFDNIEKSEYDFLKTNLNWYMNEYLINDLLKNHNNIDFYSDGNLGENNKNNQKKKIMI